MTPYTKSLLQKHDELDRYETASDFNYNDLKQQVSNLTTHLENHFALQFPIDQAQDASFFCDIHIPKDLVMDPRPNIAYSIRISNFGNLATLLMQGAYSPETNSAIQGLLNQYGFVFINADELDELYDGQWEAFKHISGNQSPTWFTRYFDYL